MPKTIRILHIPTYIHLCKIIKLLEWSEDYIHTITDNITTQTAPCTDSLCIGSAYMHCSHPPVIPCDVRVYLAT